MRALFKQLDAQGNQAWAQALLDEGIKMMTGTAGYGLPIVLHLAAANQHEITRADATLRTMPGPQHRGRPRTRPHALVTATAAAHRQVRHALRQRGIKITMPTFARRKRKKPRRDRPITVGARYPSRRKVARCCGWIDHGHRFMVRDDRYRSIYRSFCVRVRMH